MLSSVRETVELNNGVKMPWFGLGTWRTQGGPEAVKSVEWALATGYRSIDTAAVYHNEQSVGEAIRNSRVPRKDIFVTTKVWNDDQGYDSTLRAFDKSLDRLGMDYVDLYLIHWPIRGKSLETWRAMEELLQQGRARAIGVSNFLEHHVREVMGASEIVPAVNQVEFHPHLQQPDLQAFCREHGIQLEAWAPIMKGRVLDVPELQRLGEKYGKSPVQITLRWELQKGVVIIPKSVHEDRIRSNAEIFDFELAADDMKTIDALDRNERLGPHPDEFAG